MPGNQGGSNWGTTAANPSKGIVYVLNIDAVAILKLEDVNTKVGGVQIGAIGSGRTRGLRAVLRGVPWRRTCRTRSTGVPTLIGRTQRLSEDVIAGIVTGGRGSMRPVPGITNIELTAILGYSSTTGGGRGGGFGRGGGPARAFPAGPVVASGGAPTPPQPGRGAAPPAGARYPGNGANGGNERIRPMWTCHRRGTSASGA